MKPKKLVFEWDKEGMDIVIENVPKRMLKKLAKQHDVKPQFIGITEFINVEFERLNVKFSRETNRVNRIVM